MPAGEAIAVANLSIDELKAEMLAGLSLRIVERLSPAQERRAQQPALLPAPTRLSGSPQNALEIATAHGPRRMRGVGMARPSSKRTSAAGHPAD